MSTAPVDLGDPNEPVITLRGPRMISQPVGVPYVDAGATAADPHDGDITGKIVVSGLDVLDVNTLGDYLIRYNVVDSAQLPAVEVARMVRVNSAGAFREQTARDIGSTGAHLPYYEHLPVSYTADPAQKFPLIVFQHGWGGARFTADGTAVQSPLATAFGDMKELIASGLWDDSRPFIVLSPQRCIDPMIEDYTALATKIFIDYAIHTYKIDTTHMYVFGYSAGSCLTWDYVTHYPNQLAAVVPMSGSGGTTSGCTLKLTPSWAFEAADDPAGPYMNQVDTVNSINACNPVERAKITVFASGGHNTAEECLTINLTGLGQGLPAYDVYNQSIYDWVLAHTRAAPSTLPATTTGTVRLTPPLARQALPANGAAFTVAPSAVAFGHSATLSWSAAGATSCLASGDWVGSRPASGTESVTPPAPGLYGYALTCDGPAGSVSQSATLTVREPPPAASAYR
jgi:predicted esterase